LDSSYLPTWQCDRAQFFVHFFRGKSFSAEISSQFLGKTIFQNFFCGKFQFPPTFFPGKNVRKISPRTVFRKKPDPNVPNTRKFLKIINFPERYQNLVFYLASMFGRLFPKCRIFTKLVTPLIVYLK
jgi:hypothetical protein